jgi:hypothetical protein
MTNVRLKSRNLKSSRLNLKSPIIANMVVGQKIPNMRSHLMIGIGNGTNMIHQCQFDHIGHIIMHHRGLIVICLVFIHHGLQGCHLLHYTFNQLQSLMEDYQLVGHHLHIMIDISQRISLWVKLNVTCLNKFGESRKMGM